MLYWRYCVYDNSNDHLCGSYAQNYCIKTRSVALPASHLLKPLSKVLSPLITLVSFVSNGTARSFGIDLDSANKDELKPEELRTLLQTSGVPKRQEEMPWVFLIWIIYL